MGPLAGIRVVEIAGIGPAPAAGMVLADLGAEVILVERKSQNPNAAPVASGELVDAGFFRRGKKSIALDLKEQSAIETVLGLVEQSDILIEGFRPGVMERVGLGPDTCFQRNRKLIFGRMTGWGQSGPLSHSVGHDLNYLALSGALYYGGLPGDAPYPTSTVVGDVGAGSNMLVLGILAALLSAQRTGQGQVVDAAICDGAIYNQILLAGALAEDRLGGLPLEDALRGASPWSNVYRCSDGRYITVQALEPEFYRELIGKCGFSDDPDFARQYDSGCWPVAHRKMSALFASKSQSHWCAVFADTDACFAPVLSLQEAARHPHNRHRQSFIDEGALLQPAPAPRFSHTAQVVGEIPKKGQHTEEILRMLNPVDA